MKRTTRHVSAIQVTKRYREDVGDLRPLVASIERRGLIQPIAIRPDGELLVGLRRLLAWKQSARRGDSIPVVEISGDLAQVIAQHDDNLLRKDLTHSEKVYLMRELMPALQDESRHRRVSLGRTHGLDPDGQFARRGESRTVAAALLGTSPNTLRKAAAIVDAARAEPERFGRLQEAMDRSGRVDGPFKRLRVMRMAEQIRAEPPPLPGRGPYRFAAIDPPWPFDADREDPSERGTHPYPQISYAAIEALPVRAIMHDDSAIGLWTTNHHLERSFGVLAAYGFEPRTVLTWVKDKIGRGQYLREQSEHCLIAVRGRPVFTLTNQSTVLQAGRLEHSRKPDAFYALVESLCPAPAYAALFSHNLVRPGWDTHSTEILDEAAGPDAIADDAA